MHAAFVKAISSTLKTYMNKEFKQRVEVASMDIINTFLGNIHVHGYIESCMSCHVNVFETGLGNVV